MANEVTITVRDRDLTDPQKVRARWRSAGRDIERDAEKSGKAAGDKSGKGWLAGLKSAAGDGGGGGIAKAIAGSFTSAFEVSAKSAATAFSAQFLASVAAGLASGAAKIAHGAAAMAALLPAAAVAGVAAMGTLKLALVGVGDALGEAVTGDAKAFNEAIKGLAPPAQAFAREVRAMRGDLTGLKDTVQGRFFEQFAGQITKLARTWLPILNHELGALSEGFGDAASSFMGWARQPAVVLTLTVALRNARGAIANLLAGAGNLAKAFLPLVAVGSTFLPRLTSGFGDATARLAAFMQRAADTGKLAGFIQGGLDKLRALGETFAQVWRIGGNVVDIFREFASVGGGAMAALGLETGGLLDGLEQLTEKARVFFASGSGGAAITEVFGILRSLMSATFGTLAHLVPIIGRAFAPILPQLSQFAEAVVNLQFALADALEPALAAVANILGAILPPLTSVMNLIADNGPAAAALAGAILTLYGAWKLLSTVVKVAELGLTGAAVGMGAAAAAAGGVAMALIQMDAANHAKQIDDMVESFTALGGAVNDQTRTMLYMNQVMGTQDEFVQGLIDSNPRLAQSLIDNAEAFGISADDAARYQDELDTTTAAIDNQVSALERQKNALRAQTDPFFAATEAQRRLAEAQQHLIDVQNDENATAADVAAAHQAVSEAAAGNETAMYDLGIAMEAGDTSLKKVLKSLQAQRDSGAITQESYNQLAAVATLKFGQVENSIRRVPGAHTTTLTVRDFASSAADGVRRMLDRLHDKHITISVGMAVGAGVGAVLANMAHGGITSAAGGGPRSRMTWVGEHGPELVDLAPGSRVHSNPDSQRMSAQAAGGGGVTLVYQGDGSPLDRALFDYFRRRILTEHGGNVQAALGY